MAIDHDHDHDHDCSVSADGCDVSPAIVDPASYTFPDHRLRKVMDDPSKTPLLLVACGSFSPVTYLHLRMFEMAADYVKFSTEFELIGGYLSPVADAYGKAGLASASDRYVCSSLSSSFYSSVCLSIITML